MIQYLKLVLNFAFRTIATSAEENSLFLLAWKSGENLVLWQVVIVATTSHILQGTSIKY